MQIMITWGQLLIGLGVLLILYYAVLSVLFRKNNRNKKDINKSPDNAESSGM